MGKKGSKCGFASMDPEKVREIARIGGMEAHRRGTAHEFTSGEAHLAGQKGGLVTSQDRAHMAEIGRKGGEATSRDSQHMANIGSLPRRRYRRRRESI